MTDNKIQALTKLNQQIKVLITFFIIALVLSGLTAFPIKAQLEIADSLIRSHHWKSEFTDWLEKVYRGVVESEMKFPFLAYGTDWLAFAHLVIAIAFIGPLRDPVRNIWIIQFGLISCIAVFPLALIAGEIRGIPLFWRMLDCSFGLFGGIVLWSIHRKIRQFEKEL